MHLSRSDVNITSPLPILASLTTQIALTSSPLDQSVIMRFSTIAVSFLSGLSAIKGVVASPIHPVTDVQVQKRETIVEVVNDLKSSIVSRFVLTLSLP